VEHPLIALGERPLIDYALTFGRPNTITTFFLLLLDYSMTRHKAVSMFYTYGRFRLLAGLSSPPMRWIWMR
jgi:hypothetical protein